MSVPNVSDAQPASNRQKRLIPAAEFRRRLGNISKVTEWRQRRDDPDFPKPIPIRNTRHYEEGEAEAYIELLLARRNAR